MCNITVEQVIGIGVPLTDLRIIGTVEDCPEPFEGPQLEVAISCESVDGPFTSWQSADIFDDQWEIVIPIADQPCRCPGTVFVTARCNAVPECVLEPTPMEIPDCIECPIVELAALDDAGQSPVRWRCNSDGTVSVTIEVQVTNTTSNHIEAELDCGPNGTSEFKGSISISPGGGSGTFTNICRYPTPVTPQPFVTIFFGAGPDRVPSNCPPFRIPVGFIPECRPPEDCPEILSVQIQMQGCERDETDGQLKRRVTFIPDWWGPTPLSHQWNLGNGEIIPDPIPVGGNGPPTNFDFLYSEKPLSEPSLTIFGPDGCVDSYSIELDNFIGFQMCECPEIVDIDVTIGRCEKDDDDDDIIKRKVTFTPTLSGPTPLAYEWDFGDGDSDIGAGTPGVVDHLYSSAPTTEPFLRIVADEPCQEEIYEVPLSEFNSFKPCGDDDKNGGGDSGFCAGLLITAISLIVLGGITTVVGVCFGIPPATVVGAVTAAVGLVLFGIWALFCRKFTSCGVLETIRCWLNRLSLLAFIVAIILAITVGITCGLTSAANSAAWGGLAAIISDIMVNKKCKIGTCFPFN